MWLTSETGWTQQNPAGIHQTQWHSEEQSGASNVVTNVVDGDPESEFWLHLVGDAPAFCAFDLGDLGSCTTLTRFRVTVYGDWAIPRNTSLLYAGNLEGAAWRAAVGLEVQPCAPDETCTSTSADFEPITARFWKLEIRSVWDGSEYLVLNEVEFYGLPVSCGA